MHVRACVSRPNGAAGCPPPPSPFHGHSEPTTRPRSQCHCSRPLGCGCRATPQGRLCAGCWLMGKVWSGPGMGEPTDSLTAHARPALDPQCPIGGLSLVSPRLSSSLLVSPRLSHECPRLLPTALCPLPTAPSPPSFSHSCGILGAARAG
jgi:hypothetical protein